MAAATNGPGGYTTSTVSERRIVSTGASGDPQAQAPLAAYSNQGADVQAKPYVANNNPVATAATTPCHCPPPYSEVSLCCYTLLLTFSPSILSECFAGLKFDTLTNKKFSLGRTHQRYHSLKYLEVSSLKDDPAGKSVNR